MQVIFFKHLHLGTDILSSRFTHYSLVEEALLGAGAGHHSNSHRGTFTSQGDANHTKVHPPAPALAPWPEGLRA